MSAFGTLPSWAIGQRGIGPLRHGNGVTGTHVAAMKVLMAVAIDVDFYTRAAEITNDRLMHLTGLSRPMLLPAVTALVDRGILEVDNTGYRNRYMQVQDPEDRRWSKLPAAAVTKAMQQMNNRGASVLAAWKIYLKLLESRRPVTSSTVISHRKLVEALSLPTRDVAAGVDHLVIHRLLHVREQPSMSNIGHPVHEYVLAGDFREPGHSTPTPVAIVDAFAN